MILLCVITVIFVAEFTVYVICECLFVFLSYITTCFQYFSF